MALQPAEKDAIRDSAETLKDEAAKQMPDAGKLKRWGSQLVELGRELGLRVVTSEITTALHNIFWWWLVAVAGGLLKRGRGPMRRF